MSIPELENLTSKQKGEWAFRTVLLALTCIGGIIATVVLSYVRSSADTLTRVNNDVIQIKWELPMIKSTMVSDKISIQNQIDNIQARIDAVRNSGEGRNQQIADLKTELALLKQRITP